MTPVTFIPIDQTIIPRRGTLYSGIIPEEWVGLSRDHNFVGLQVIINNEAHTILGVERFLPASPFRSGEMIGVLV